MRYFYNRKKAAKRLRKSCVRSVLIQQQTSLAFFRNKLLCQFVAAAACRSISPFFAQVQCFTHFPAVLQNYSVPLPERTLEVRWLLLLLSFPICGVWFLRAEENKVLWDGGCWWIMALSRAVCTCFVEISTKSFYFLKLFFSKNIFRQLTPLQMNPSEPLK